MCEIKWLVIWLNMGRSDIEMHLLGKRRTEHPIHGMAGLGIAANYYETSKKE